MAALTAASYKKSGIEINESALRHAQLEKLPANIAARYLNTNFTLKDINAPLTPEEKKMKQVSDDYTKASKKITKQFTNKEISAEEYTSKIKAFAIPMQKLSKEIAKKVKPGIRTCTFSENKTRTQATQLENDEYKSVGEIDIENSKLSYLMVKSKDNNLRTFSITSQTIKDGKLYHMTNCGVVLRVEDKQKKVGSALHSLSMKIKKL